MSSTWKQFWDTYRYAGTVSAETLLEQVGRTVNGKPVDQREFELSAQIVADKLQLAATDVLFEYCCGNGLVSRVLAPRVRQLHGMDFTEHLIEAARRFSAAANVRYHYGDALEPIRDRVGQDRPTKFLMAFALGHFQPTELERILSHAYDAAGGPVPFLFTGVPDEDRKWDFYNTPERQARYRALQASNDAINDGIGRWWSFEELREAGRRHGVEAEVGREPGASNHFRMAVLLRPAA